MNPSRVDRASGLHSAVIVDLVRTPIGKYAGSLSRVRPDDLAALVIKALIARAGAEHLPVDEVYWGAANQAGEDNRNVARMAALLAGLPVEVAGATVNRLCGSGMQAILSAVREIQVGAGRAYIAGGSESMSRAPYVTLKPDAAFSRSPSPLLDTTVGWRLINPRMEEAYAAISLGETAENLAAKFRISRQSQDEFALDSHRRAVAAQDSGMFNEEIIEVPTPSRANEGEVVRIDEGPRRDTSLEKLARLKPAFVRDGTVTAGNSSQVNDGAAAVLVMSEASATDLGLKPLARFVSAGVAGVHPHVMGLGPVPATKKALASAGLVISDIDLTEINEAFASQAIACIQELGLDIEKTNVNGGAIALGHPLGASGARIVTSLVYEMRRRQVQFGLATMCVGVGQGISLIVENCGE